MRLQTKILVPLILTFLLLGILAAGATYYLGRNYAIAEAKPQLLSAADQLAGTTWRVVEDHEEIVEELAKRKRALDTARSNGSEDRSNAARLEAELLDYLAERTRSAPLVLSLYDASGTETLRFVNGSAVTDGSVPRNRTGDPAFDRVLDRFLERQRWRTLIFVNGDEANKSLVFVEGIRNGGAFAGFAWGEIPLGDLLREVTGLKPFGSGGAALYGANGTRFDVGVPMDLPATLPHLAPFGPQSAATLVDEGSDTLYAFQRSLYLGFRDPWILVVYVPMKSVVGAVQGTLLVFAAGGLAILAALVTVVAVAVRRSLRPLDEMSVALDSIGSGNLDVRIAPSSTKELRALAEGINRMAQHLAEREAQVRSQAETQARLEKFATLGTLSAGVGHEVNNPLTIMVMNLQLLRGDLEDLAATAEAPPSVKEWAAEQTKNAKANLEAAQRIKKIVSSMRLLAKPQQTAEPVDLSGILEATVALASGRLRQRARFEAQIPQGARTVGCADTLGQVFLNLLINAADAVPENEGWIGLTCESRDGRVRVLVEDNGCGIPEVVRGQMFTPFVTTKKHGTGLGLSICHRIVSESGGELRFEDRPGGGTRFIVDLPAAPEPEPVPESAAGPDRAASSS